MTLGESSKHKILSVIKRKCPDGQIKFIIVETI